MAEDDPATAVDVLANDTDVDGGPKSIGSVTQPANGTVVITGGGTGLTYQPDANYCNAGPPFDTFTYTLSPGGSTGTVDVTVTCVDDPPVAVDDSATVTEDDPATAVDVLANDTDIDGGPKSVASVTQPANGTVVITGGGSGLTYAPDANYCNDPPGTTPDTFTYTLAPGGSTATVSVIVTCVDDPPVAVDDADSVIVDAPAAAVNVLANDTDIDGGPKSIDSVTQPANGTVVITGGGAGLTYQPDAGYCNDGSPLDTFTYTLTPGSSTATVDMTVVCDIAPTAVDDSATVAEDAAATAVDVLANDTDPDGGPKAVASVTQPANGTLAITGGGTGLTYAPDANYCNNPPGTTPDTFTYTLTPGGSTATVSMTVTCVDDPPVAVDDSATVTEDDAATAVPVLANDTDIDGGPESIGSVTQPDNGAVVITGGGTGLTYAPDANYCNDPPGTTPDTFTYTLSPGSSTATVSVTVTCVNDAPVAGDDTFSAANSAVGNTVLVVDAPGDGPPSVSGAKKSISGNILANDTDVDGPNTLAVVAGTFATNDGGSVVIESDGDFTFTPAAGTSCTDNSDFFDYTVSDGDSPTPATDTGRVTISISGCVWYVNNNAAGNSGTSTAPFDTLAQAQTASGSGDTIFVFDGDNTTTGYSAGFDLKTNQRLLGETADLQIGADLLYTGVPGNRPTITDNNADVVVLASGSTVRGVQLDPQGTGGGLAGGNGTAPGSITGSTIDDVRIIDTGTAGTQPGLELDTTAGTFDVSNLTVSNGGSATAIGVRLFNAGTVNVASAGTVSVTTAGAKALDVTGTGLGAGSEFDDITVTGSGTGGVAMDNVTGTTTFTNLALTTTSGATPALLLTNPGSVTVPSAGTATISATGGPAVDITGAGSYAFDDVDSSNSSSDGVNLASFGSGTFAAGSGSTLSGAATVGFDLDGGNGAVSFPGTISTSAASSRPVEVTNRTGGTASFGGAVTGTGSGVNLVANTGATVRFDGGLSLSTATNAAFTATGGGTVIATQNNTSVVNTLTTTTGTALNVANTSIGAAGLTFRSISSNGATNGIVLNATGSSGGLTVVGNGGTCSSSATCTGGVIVNTTSAVSLANTRDVSIDRLFIQNSTGDGIDGTTTTNFSFTNGRIDNSGTGLGAETSNIGFDTTAAGTENNLSGTVTITGNTLTNAYYHGIDIFDFNGTITSATITGNTITSTTSTATSKGTGIRLVAFGSASTVSNVTKATIDNNTISNFPSANGILASAGNGNAAGSPGTFGTVGSGTNVIAITNNTLVGNPKFGAFGIGVTDNGRGQANVNVTGNSVTNTIGTAISVGSFGFANLSATVNNNTVVAHNISGAQGIGAGTSQTFGATDTPTLTLTATGNNVSQVDGNGILVTARDATGQVNATIKNNTVATPLSGNRNGIRVDAGNAISVNDSMCVDIASNTSSGSGLSPEAIGLRKQGTVTSVNAFGVEGMAATATPGVEAYVSGKQNAGSQSTLLISATSGFSSCNSAP